MSIAEKERPLTTKRSAIRGVIYNWITYLSQIVIVFYATPIYVRELGLERYGVWTLIMSFTAWYVLADFGLRGAAVKFISQFEAEDNHRAIDQVVVTAIGIYLVFTPILMLVAGAVAWYFPTWFPTETQTDSTVRMVVFVSAGAVAVNLLGQVFDAALMALRRFDLVNIGALGSQVLQATLIVIAVQNGRGLLTMSAIVFGVTCLNQLYRFVMAYKVLKGISLRPSNFCKDLLWKLGCFGGLSSIQIIAREGAMPLGNLFIGKILGVTLVPFFSIGGQLADYGARLATGVAGPLMPVASQLDTLGREKILRRAFTLGTKTLLAMGLIMAIVLISVGYPLIMYWMPDDLKKGGNIADFAGETYPILCILLPAYVFRMVGLGSRSILMGTNRMYFLGVLGLIEIILTVTVGLGLLRYMDWAGGMALGILVAQFITSGTAIPIATARVVDVSFGKFLQTIIWPAFSSAMPVAAAGCAVWYFNNSGGPLAAQNVYHVIFQALGIGLIGALSMFFLCFDQHLRNDILSSFIGKKFLKSPTGSLLLALPISKQLLTPLLTHTGRGKPAATEGEGSTGGDETETDESGNREA